MQNIADRIKALGAEMERDTFFGSRNDETCLYGKEQRKKSRIFHTVGIRDN